MEQAVVQQLELYRDDSVIAIFSDGSKLLLSACGASFLHVDSISRHQQPYPSEIQHSTQFAVSSYQQKLRLALEFRNKFAERPFLCTLTGQERKKVRNTPIEVVTWPLCLHCISKTTSGNLLLHSVDRNASIELMCNSRVFTVTYWAAINSSNKKHCNEAHSAVIHHPLTLWYSVTDVPDAWSRPLELLVTAATDNTECCHSNEQVCSVLPSALPIMCRNVHMHKWKKSATDQPAVSDMLKIFWSDHVTYRLMWTKQCVEAYPNQDTVIGSCDPQGRYYDMWCTNEARETVQYKICYDQLPQCKPFSMTAVIGKMSRLLQSMIGWNEETATWSVCWAVNNEEVPAVPVKQELVKEEASITDIGRFMAYHSGRIYIAFVDKTMLEMYWPPMIGSHCSNNKVMLPHDHLPPGYCRLLLSNGQYQILPVLHPPQPYQRYVEYAVRWGQWVYCEHNRHGDTFIDNGPEYNSVALDEVAKIRQLLEDTSGCGDDAVAGPSHSSTAAVISILPAASHRTPTNV